MSDRYKLQEMDVDEQDYCAGSLRISLIQVPRREIIKKGVNVER